MGTRIIAVEILVDVEYETGFCAVGVGYLVQCSGGAVGDECFGRGPVVTRKKDELGRCAVSWFR